MLKKTKNVFNMTNLTKSKLSINVYVITIYFGFLYPLSLL